MKNASRFLLVLLLSSSLFSCGSSSPSLVRGVYDMFGTSSFAIYLYGASEHQLSELSDQLNELSELTDAYTPPSEGKVTLYSVNHTNDPIAVDPRLADVLRFSLLMEKETDGYFNPLVGALTTLWKEGIEAETPYLPASSAIQSCLNDMASSSLTVEGNLVQRKGNAIVDLGALAKGYSLRGALAYLRKEKITSYLINGGSSSMIMGSTADKGAWKVNFRDYPNAYFFAMNTGIGTSSVSEQGALIDGKTYSHIVNPFTGSAEARYVMASIRGDDPGVDDVLSTVFMLAGEEKAPDFASKFNLAYAFYDGKNFIASDNLEVTFSSNTSSLS